MVHLRFVHILGLLSATVADTAAACPQAKMPPGTKCTVEKLQCKYDVLRCPFGGNVYQNVATCVHGLWMLEASSMQCQVQSISGSADTCESCVENGRGWQDGRCNPGSACPVAEKECLTTRASCARWRQVESGWHPGESEQKKTCETCVSSGRSWQTGQCNEGSDCPVADLGCFTDLPGCARWHKQQLAKAVCQKAQGDCENCVRADSLCMWKIAQGKCFMGADYWDSDSKVARDVQACVSAGAIKILPIDAHDVNHVVAFSLRVKSMDYTALTATVHMHILDRFKAAVKSAVSYAAGPHILPDHVDLSVSAGTGHPSVIIDVSVHPPAAVGLEAIQGTLSENRVLSQVTDAIRSVRGIFAVSNGSPVVSFQDPPPGHPDDRSTSQTTSESSTSIMIIGAIIGGAALLASVLGVGFFVYRRRSARMFKSFEDTPSEKKRHQTEKAKGQQDPGRQGSKERFFAGDGTSSVNSTFPLSPPTKHNMQLEAPVEAPAANNNQEAVGKACDVDV